jgi:hypothetical protein
MIQTGVTSMLNCYGLNVLHHFIYQSYLNRKRLALEEELQDVLEAKAESVLSNQRIGYDLFLGIVKTPRVQKMSPGNAKVEVVSSVTSTPLQQVGQPPIPRRTFHTKPPPIELPPKGHDTKKALDDFFRDDDSDDGIIPSVAKSNQSDDDEDDFYYDDDGHRMVSKDTGEVAVSKIQSSSPKPYVTTSPNVKVKKQLAAMTGSIQKSSKGKAKDGKVSDTKKASSGSHGLVPHLQNKVIDTEPARVRSEDLANACNETDSSKLKKATGDGENGWDDDDDLDLEDDDDDADGGPQADVSSRNELDDKLQSDMSGPSIGCGDDDEPDLDDDKSDSRVPAEPSLGRGDHGVLERDDGKHDGSHHATPSVVHVESSASSEGVVGIAAEQSMILRGDNRTSVETKTESVSNRRRRQRDASSKGIDDTPDDCVGDDGEYSRSALAQLENPTNNGCSVDDGAADDDEYIIGKAEHNHLATTNAMAKDDDADDEEFMIEGDYSSHAVAPGDKGKVRGLVGEDSLPSHGDNNPVMLVDDAEVPSAQKSGGLSTAAMAAIQEAEREAQRMLERDVSAQMDDGAKKMKKKKKKKEGAEKKRQKQSRSVVIVCDDAA